MVSRAFQAVVDSRRVRRLMDRAPKELARAVGGAMDDHAFAFRSYFIRQRFAGRPTGLTTRTGTLQRTVGHRIRYANTLRGLRLGIFVGGGRARYAGIQQYGGVVRGNPWLTVPLSDNKTPSGDTRFKSARRLRDSQPGKTFLVRTTRGKLLIGYRPARSRGVLWLWVLKRAVRLKPRLGFFETFVRRPMVQDRRRRFALALRIALRAAKGGS